MNRRQFVSRVSLGTAAACTSFAKPSLAAAVSGRVNIRFIGMMGFVERGDRSFLVATPGQGHHATHVPFLMARAGSPIAKALGLRPAPGVVPEAFDTELTNTRPSDFVYRSLENTAVEVVSGASDAVKNEASEMAQMTRIAPGKRLRGNLEKWASSTISLRGGRLENSSAHPDAGKVWKFGHFSQRLTDAVNFKNAAGVSTSIRLTSGRDVSSYSAGAEESAELWVFSAAMMEATSGNATRIEHSKLMFDYLVDAQPILAECPEATGRQVPPTEVPFVTPTSASMGIIASESAFPPETWFCFMGVFSGGTSKG